MQEKYVYVVTRNKRRIEEKNYTSQKDAEARAHNLKQCLKKDYWDPADAKNVSVVRTSKPNRIR